MKKMFLLLICLAALAFAATPVVLTAEALTPSDLPPLPYYAEFRGTVQEINPWYNLDGSESDTLLVLLTDGDNGPLNVLVEEKTYMLTENELKIGSSVIGYYSGRTPMIMIYPPRYTALLLAVDLEPAQSVKASLFGEDLVSEDNELKLNIGPDTEIILQNGEQAPAGLDLSDRKLAVFYTVSTRSIPAQTTPERVIVLDDEKTAETLPEENLAPENSFAQDNMPLAVDDMLLLNAPPVYVQADGTVMIPLRAVAEALGYTVGWQNGTVTLDGTAMAVIGQDGAELRKGFTYVPLSFFRETLKINNAYVFEGRIEINNGEKLK